MALENHTQIGKLYQDQIHGTKVLTPLAVEIIDTPEFQRLSGLRQLGFANISYRGAEHTRFAHSIGTYFLTRTILRRIVQNHERLGLGHPGENLSKCFRVIPPNSYLPTEKLDRLAVSHQSLWRGLTEVVSTAALLHDIGHIPFGHTLEDEFTGIYEPHDKLAGPRLYELLFNKESGLRRVFSDSIPKWIKGVGDGKGLSNEDLARLIYVILSWKERVVPRCGFERLIDEQIEKKPTGQSLKRLEDLKQWHSDFKARKMFHPFISDVIANTICADLLDYLPRDRMNLGMECQDHTRLQRYLTIRPGTLYSPDEGLRVCIMVTRRGKGGQRRDVATAVLAIMRERYEMAERVYYHHKKAAASTMLAKLMEICADEDKPADDEKIYPAPWTFVRETHSIRPNIAHFSDLTLIDYLGKAKVDPKNKNLQKQLYLGIKYDRRAIYRTLLVVDIDLVQLSNHPISFFTEKLRGLPNQGRLELEKDLADVADSEGGEVLVYCPSPDMQSKEVDARLEITENRVLPLRVQSESFTYYQDVRVIEQYYQDLWRMYIFVSPSIFDNPKKCRAIVDKFCELYRIPRISAYSKVRSHIFLIDEDVAVGRALEPLHRFFHSSEEGGLPFNDTPTPIVAAILEKASNDLGFLENIKSGTDSLPRITSLFDIAICEKAKKAAKNKKERAALSKYIQILESRKKRPQLAARGGSYESFKDYEKNLIEAVLRTESEKEDSV